MASVTTTAMAAPTQAALNARSGLPAPMLVPTMATTARPEVRCKRDASQQIIGKQRYGAGRDAQPRKRPPPEDQHRRHLNQKDCTDARHCGRERHVARAANDSGERIEPPYEYGSGKYPIRI